MRFIPADLLPIKPSSYTLAWGRNTYHHAFKFSCAFVCSTNLSDNEIMKWVSFAKELSDELRNDGKLACEQYIVTLAKDQFKWRLPSHQPPVRFDDVITIIGQENFFDVCRDDKSRQIHLSTYSIFRMGYNNWAQALVKKWLDKYSLCLSYLNEERITSCQQGKHPRKLKGFVYSILVS